MQKQADKKKIAGLTFKKRDKVYLLQLNLRTKKLNNKLNSLRISLFKVIKQTRLVNYKLNLLALIKRLHLVFYVKLLELALPKVKTVKEPKLEPLEKFTVKNILGLRKFRR